MKKYEISQELMNEINEWKTIVSPDVADRDLFKEVIGRDIKNWWRRGYTPIDRNNRLIALIQHVNGEDVFELEKPKKWVVRSKQRTFNNEYQFLTMYDNAGNRIYTFPTDVYSLDTIYLNRVATKFDSKEEAEKWTNPLMEVVEVDW